ncbi:hypothetical protein LCGC14_1855620 [marine sediment metagenome]|uniref:Uncharacterized protein n=1 Tax=marine sediment metagenome TaxID=412755 RepID=A0A0F9G8Y6_9ZZZZ
MTYLMYYLINTIAGTTTNDDTIIVAKHRPEHREEHREEQKMTGNENLKYKLTGGTPG